MKTKFHVFIKCYYTVKNLTGLVNTNIPFCKPTKVRLHYFMNEKKFLHISMVFYVSIILCNYLFNLL